MICTGRRDLHVIARYPHHAIEEEIERHVDAVAQADNLAEVCMALQRQTDAVQRIGSHHDHGVGTELADIARDLQVQRYLPQRMEQSARPAQLTQNLPAAIFDRHGEVLLPGVVVAQCRR